VPDNEETALAFHRTGVKVMEHQGYNNFATTLMCMRPDNDAINIAIIPEMQAGRAYEIVQMAILSLDYTPSAVSITTDTYCYHMKDSSPEEMDTYVDRRKKSLSQMFAEGHPNVREMLHTMMLSETGSVVIGQSYRWSTLDGWEWDEEAISSESDWDFARLVSGQPKLDRHGNPLCPICGNFIPSNFAPGAYPGALSRYDSRIEICTSCGVKQMATTHMERKNE